VGGKEKNESRFAMWLRGRRQGNRASGSKGGREGKGLSPGGRAVRKDGGGPEGRKKLNPEKRDTGGLNT